MTKNYFINHFLAFLLISFLFCSCATRKEVTLFTSPSDIVTDTIKQVYVVNDKGADEIYYKIKIDDRIAIRNIQNKKFGTSTTNADASSTGSQATLSYAVDIDGNIELPAIGKVAIVGLTIREAKNKIQNLYANQLLVDPIIDLSVVNLKVTLLGEFNKQGNFLLAKENTNLIEVIGEAGGIPKTANPKTLRIIRGDRAHPEIIYVNLSDINSLASKKLVLQDNDIITLQALKSSASSDKLQQFNNIMQPIMIVVNLAILIFSLTK